MLESLFGSKSRALIIKVLFTEEHRKVHLRELSRLTGVSAPTLQREAKSLVNIGVLVENKEANRVVYEANKLSPIYGPLMELATKAADGIEQLKEVFKDSESRVVFVYGSRASGKARADSDYDVFVIGDEGLRKLAKRIAPLRESLGVEVNPYVVTPEEFARRMKDGDHFLSDVMAKPKIFLKGGEDELGAMEG